jgi:hypothetical protein
VLGHSVRKIVCEVVNLYRSMERKKAFDWLHGTSFISCLQLPPDRDTDLAIRQGSSTTAVSRQAEQGTVEWCVRVLAQSSLYRVQPVSKAVQTLMGVHAIAHTLVSEWARQCACLPLLYLLRDLLVFLLEQTMIQ